MSDFVRDIEVWGGVGLDVVDVYVVDGVGLPGGDVEAAPHTVHFQVTVNLNQIPNVLKRLKVTRNYFWD